MEGGIEGIADLVRNLDITGDTFENRGQERKRSTHNHLVTLQTTVDKLIRLTSTITLQAQSINSLSNDANSSGVLSEAYSLHEGIKKLTSITHNLQTTVETLTEATERSVIRRLKTYGSHTGTICELLLHFDDQIKGIVREVLNHTNGREVLWKVAEECFNQATRLSGNLDANDYFDPLEESRLQWPYDPDFESEEYYEHENRLSVDEDYAAAFKDQISRRFDARSKDRQSWPDFWITVLTKVPHGPTLFYPPASLCMQSLNLDAEPPYLFRTFDEVSSGRNDDSVVASTASVFSPQDSSRTDLLGLERHRATELLHQHLTKSCFHGKVSDNLMSWSSSLLFTVQYAIWRARIRKCPRSDIKICIVDTRKFPKGQFVQDLWLIRAYYATAADIGGETQRFFRFRLENENFYNGEYLSQGEVNHGGRSCVISLKQLLDAGLSQLYPEFEEPRGSEKWPHRVMELRQSWSAEQVTTDREIQLAFGVARKCFAEFEPSEIAPILLTFKNRNSLSGLKPADQFDNQRPKWADKPDEVRRYWMATQSYNEHPNAQINRLLLNIHAQPSA
ncbi:uncharacterized protein PV07_12558 [Cladophialophora immunda]|uniref:DUF7587 domain-containing protein n=1 Tax=Cladophialophora immunda TaxID=569365 RepID=A0A0D2BUH5_9EURO|nr:uncharacterized protein PV07_12558 [Cladophialophora immunda]KIW22040.1 hypothetical protein PV07_12558 [Cladophialophora immunda]